MLGKIFNYKILNLRKILNVSKCLKTHSCSCAFHQHIPALYKLLEMSLRPTEPSLPLEK